jgi:hypothetical protein
MIMVGFFFISFNPHGMPNQLATEINYQLAPPKLMSKEKFDPLDSKRMCHQVMDR